MVGAVVDGACLVKLLIRQRWEVAFLPRRDARLEPRAKQNVSVSVGLELELESHVTRASGAWSLKASTGED